jgi:hypothetical protein
MVSDIFGGKAPYVARQRTLLLKDGLLKHPSNFFQTELIPIGTIPGVEYVAKCGRIAGARIDLQRACPFGLNGDLVTIMFSLIVSPEPLLKVYSVKFSLLQIGYLSASISLMRYGPRG